MGGWISVVYDVSYSLCKTYEFANPIYSPIESVLQIFLLPVRVNSPCIVQLLFDGQEQRRDFGSCLCRVEAVVSLRSRRSGRVRTGRCRCGREGGEHESIRVKQGSRVE